MDDEIKKEDGVKEEDGADAEEAQPAAAPIPDEEKTEEGDRGIEA